MPSDRLRDNLVLASYLQSLLGASSFEEIKTNLRDVPEGYDEEDVSYMAKKVIGWPGVDATVRDKIIKYDQNIIKHLHHINRYRKDEMPITLKYFQWLALLCTEIYLDRFFNDRASLTRQLSAYALNNFGSGFTYHIGRLGKKNDFTKLAYWMATGSGKTLILHINILQWLHYNQGPRRLATDKIILLTPNERLSVQHIAEMRKSSIPAEMYQTGYFAGLLDPNTVHIIDIHKLYDSEKERDKVRNDLEPRNPKAKRSTDPGVRIDIHTIGSNNLLLVDEGHTGSSGKEWIEIRKYLEKDGFTLEYSATFGQAIRNNGGNVNRDLLQTYGKATIIDYSYPYFHGDYFGKDFSLLNLKREDNTPYSQDFKQTIMLANLLTFYEQRLIYDTHQEEVREYNIDAPLWIFVGRTVQLRSRGRETDVLRENIEQTSDILEVLRFFNNILLNENNDIIQKIASMLDGRSGLIDDELDRDIFARNYPETRLSYLRWCVSERGWDAATIYSDMLKRIFQAPSSGNLHIVTLRKSDGEIALRCNTTAAGDKTHPYFGIISIGDEGAFSKAVQSTEPRIQVRTDEFTTSLFSSIAYHDSSINVLIGAKKFTTGWNSYRVSCMGLINVGKQAGTEIVQLFGRGVRLRGKNYSLKRSAGFQEPTPEFLPILEKLHVFGIGADYMERFKEEMGEDLGLEYRPFRLPIVVNNEHISHNLLIPRVSTSRFLKQRIIIPDPEHYRPRNDINLRLEARLQSYERPDHPRGIVTQTVLPLCSIPSEDIEILNWTRIYFQIKDYCLERKWTNLVISENILKSIMMQDPPVYQLECFPSRIKPRSYEDLWKLEEIVISVLRKYLQAYYSTESSKYAKDTVDVQELGKDHGNLNVTYTIKVPANDKKLLENVEAIIYEGREVLLSGDANENKIGLENVFIDCHLYQPLLCLSQENGIILQPISLNPGERRFIEDLRGYINANASKIGEKKIFVLRNRVKSGIGFFETSNFYPDFIIWVIEGESQHILFVDPHGIARVNSFEEEEKIRLSTTIHADYEEPIQRKLRERTRTDSQTSIRLDSAIIAPMNTGTSKADILRNFGNQPINEFDKHHVFFQEEGDYINKLLNIIL